MEIMTQLVPLFQTIAWMLTVILVLVILRRELRSLVDKLLTAKQINLKVGPLSFQAKAMHEIRRSINSEFPDDFIRKSEIESLLESKIRGLIAAIQREATDSDVRSGERFEWCHEITITRGDGSKCTGRSLDVSRGGIGFRTFERLRRGEEVKISPSGKQKDIPVIVPGSVMIVRVEPTGEDFFYGSIVSESKK